MPDSMLRRLHQAAIGPVVLFCVTIAASNATESIIGQATVIDGDTIEIRGQRIRLAGMDAFEARQLCRDNEARRYRCGQRSAFALADYIRQRNLVCEPTGKSWDRVVAICSLNEVDLGAWLVREGWAVDDDRYEPDYHLEEQHARESKSGAWRGSFKHPMTWRDEND